MQDPRLEKCPFRARESLLASERSQWEEDTRMNMQYARAVLAHEQAYRDRARVNYLSGNHATFPPEADVGAIDLRRTGQHAEA